MISLRLEVLTQIDEALYQQICGIWSASGVANPARGDSIEVVRQTLNHGGYILVAYKDDLAVGTVWLTHDWRRLYLHHMGVVPKFQHHGIGKLLMERSIQIARELDLQVKLEVHRDNLPAQKLYQRYGFQVLEGYESMIKRDLS